MAMAIFISSPTSSAVIVLGMHRVALIVTMCTITYRVFSIFLGHFLSDLLIGLKVWVFCELTAIVIYNFLVWKKSENKF